MIKITTVLPFTMAAIIEDTKEFKDIVKMKVNDPKWLFDNADKIREGMEEIMGSGIKFISSKPVFMPVKEFQTAVLIKELFDRVGGEKSKQTNRFMLSVYLVAKAEKNI